ncbi:MAG: hypothetical protein JXB48_13125 [Candidatus Latescibacteria bacterium]|nr:hypothetical protein [Candidatus Latescibacterota bacterium]
MDKITVLFVVIAVMVVMMSFADISDASEKGRIYIGWSCKDITPDKPVSLYGQYYKRISTYVQSPLKVTALALETRAEGSVKEQAIMVSCDVISFNREVQDKIREKVTVEIPDFDVSKLFLNATHTHSAPYVGPRTSDDVEEGKGTTGAEFEVIFIDRVAEAVIEAWKARKPGGISWELGQAVVGHCRRVRYADGRAQMYGASDTEDFIDLEGPSDHGVEMLFCWNTDKKLTGIVLNVSCPSQVTEAKYYVSSDYWSEVRKQLKAKYSEDLFVLTQCGAAGDQSPRDLVRNYKGEPNMWDVPGIIEIGKRIARAVDVVYPSAKENIQTNVVFGHTVKEIKLPTRRVSEKEYQEALAIVEEIMSREPDDPNSPDTAWNRFLKIIEDNEKTKEFGPWDNKITDFGIVKKKQALVEKYKNQNNDPFYSMELHVIRLGDVAFATNPFELYLDYGFRITARSKAAQTFVIQLSGDSCGYLPTARAIPGGGYSAMVTRIGPIGGQVLVNETVEAINALW